MMHPHLKEEIEYQDYAAMGAAYHDRREAELGAEWNHNWQDEYLLTDRDVWVKNPGYLGAEGIHPEMGGEEIDAWEASSEYKFYLEAMSVYYEEMQLYITHCEEIEQGKYS
jgi:hypothetical protein